MSNTRIVGYCPELYDALQMAAHRILPYEPIDEWPPHARQYNEADRDKMVQKLLAGLTNPDEFDKDLEHYITLVFEAISDDNLKGLIEFGFIKNLVINENGYYLAVEGYTTNEAQFNQRRQDYDVPDLRRG